MKVYKALAIATLLLYATSASAIFSAQLLIGQRSGKLESSGQSNDLDSSDVGVAFHFDPIPAVPVSFGLGLNSMSFDVSMEDQGMTEMSGYTFAPQLRAWWPLGDVKPYARLGYAMGAFVGKTEFTIADEKTEIDVVYTSAGIHFGIGVEYQPAPFVSILLEWETATDVLTAQEVKVSSGDTEASGTVEDGASVDWKNSSIMFGAAFGI